MRYIHVYNESTAGADASVIRLINKVRHFTVVSTGWPGV